jgi:DNA-binding Lrp family transcriptional regulator
MRLDLDLVAKHLKCKPWREITDTATSTPDQILDYWLPPILPEMIRDDFHAFFAEKLAGKLGWLRSCMDSSFTSFKVAFSPGGYRGLADFIEWDGKLDGQFLELMLPLLQSIGECTTTPLSVKQFWTLATELCKFTIFPLSPLDVRIIKTFSTMPMITIPALARLLSTSYKKTRSRWNRLRRLNICRIPAQLNYRRLGLIPVFIELHDTKTSISSPYILSYSELAGNVRRALYFMAVPEDHITQLPSFLTRHFGTTYTLYHVEDMGQTIEFTHYQISRERWNIDWRKLFIGAHLLHNSDWSQQPELQNDDETKPHRLYIPDNKDKHLIPLLASDARTKLEKLASIAGMSVSQASRRKSRLIELEVLQPKPIIRRIGLLEDIIIRIKENDSRLLGIVNELPQAWKRKLTDYQTGNKELFVYTTLPPGSFAMIRYYLSKYIHTESNVFISGPENGGWPLTFDTFDSEKGCWNWEEPTVHEGAKVTAFDTSPRLRRVPMK